MNKLDFLGNSILAIVFRVIGACSSLLLTYTVTQYFEISDAGRIFFSIAVVTVLGILSSAGFGVALLRYVSFYYAEKDWGKIKAAVLLASKKILVISLIILLFFLITADILFLDNNKTEELLKIMIFSIPLLAFIQMIFPVFQAFKRPLISVSLINISIPLIFCLTLFSLSFFVTVSINHVGYIYIFAAFITFFWAIILLIFKAIHIHKSDESKNHEIIKSSRYLWVGLFMTSLVQWSGQIIAGMNVEPSELAPLSVSQRISVLMSFILIGINLIASPRFAASYKQKNFEELRNVSLFCSRFMIAIAIPLFLLMFFLAEYFLGFFGRQYETSAFLLRILIFGQFINLITGSVGPILNMTGHERDMRNIVIISGSLALALGVALIPTFGVLGAAISTASSMAAQNLLAVYIVKKRLGFNTLNILKQ